MLEAGTELLMRSVTAGNDESMADVMSHIRVVDVVDEATRLEVAKLGGDAADYAKRTIGLLYQVWPTQGAYQADLAAHIVAMDNEVRPHPIDIMALAEQGLSGSDLVRCAMTISWHSVRNDKVFHLWMAFYAHTGSAQVRDALRDTYGAVHTSATRLWETLLPLSGRRIRSPYQLEHLMRATGALLEGFALQWIGDPQAFEITDGELGTDLAITAIMALFEQFTEPTEREDPGV